MDMPKQKRRGYAPVPLPDQVALVLQGGGALGSFQAGVIESLAQLSIEIDWVAGISIGAINAAIIAGNPPERWVDQLNRFWETVSGSLPALDLPEERKLRESVHLGAAAMVAMWGVPGFFHPNLLPSWLAPAGSLQSLAFYDTSPLRVTLDALVDWDRVNHGPMRFSIGAVDIENGNFVYFDNHDPDWKGRIDARHVMPRARCRRAFRRSRSTGAIIGTAASSPTRRSAMCSITRMATCWSSRSICSLPKARCRRASPAPIRARRTFNIRAAPDR